MGIQRAFVICMFPRQRQEQNKVLSYYIVVTQFINLFETSTKTCRCEYSHLFLGTFTIVIKLSGSSTPAEALSLVFSHNFRKVQRGHTEWDQIGVICQGTHRKGVETGKVAGADLRRLVREIWEDLNPLGDTSASLSLLTFLCIASFMSLSLPLAMLHCKSVCTHTHSEQPRMYKCRHKHKEERVVFFLFCFQKRNPASLVVACVAVMTSW